MPQYHLGIYTGHDTGAAVVDGELNILNVFEEERFNGEKMTYFNPYYSLKQVIKLGFGHFRTITFGFDPDEAEADFLKKFVGFQKVRSAEVLGYLSGKITWDEVCFVGHHDCHAAGAFFPSGFDEAIIMVADGTGESESTSFYAGKGNSISRLSSEPTHDFSIGILYQYFTEWLGYRSHNTSQHCGKIMGLASYGRPVYKERIRKILDNNDGGYMWPGGSLMDMRKEIVKAFGPPQPRPTMEYNSLQADVAASIQALIEEIIIEKLQTTKITHPFENLCFSGGVAMNSLLNYRILKSKICKEFFVQPLASDRGIALGAAIASAARSSKIRSIVPKKRMKNVYAGYGEDSPQAELDRLVKEYDLPIYIERRDTLPGEIAQLLHSGQILALFQGRQEIGPRALGNRSIMAAPTTQSRNKTNQMVKYREPWRPFAPTVLEQEVGTFFDIERSEPFMTVIYGILPGMTEGIEGIAHVDGTARLQTVNRSQNLLFTSIIEEYQKLSGIPIILNTSFNINAQPIIRTVYDAVLTFLCCGVDGLMIENTLVRKRAGLPKDHINRLDRILYEATRAASSIVVQLLDYSSETETLLAELIDCSCIKFRKGFKPKPISKCYIKGHTKMSWNIISRISPLVEKFIYGDEESPRIDDGEIFIAVSGKRLIEASSKPTRTYVGFDRDVLRELIDEYSNFPDNDRYYILDREFHLFDMDYLHSRFDSCCIEGARASSYGSRYPDSNRDIDGTASDFKDSSGDEQSIRSEREDMYEALADA